MPMTIAPRYMGLRDQRYGPLVTNAEWTVEEGRISALCRRNVDSPPQKPREEHEDTGRLPDNGRKPEFFANPERNGDLP